MSKKQLLRHLWRGTKHTSISKKYCRLFAITEVLRKNFTGVGAYSNMSAYLVKYISINILNKVLQMAVPTTGNYNQMGVKWNCSFVYTRFILSLRPCYTVQFPQQLVSQCHCETSCWRIPQCNIGCLAIFLLRKTLHEVEPSSTFRNGLQQLTRPLHSVSTLQQLVSQFYGSFNKGACAHFLLFRSEEHCETSCRENCTV